MSYVIHIWENPAELPLPTSIDDAVQLLDKLSAQPMNSVNPKFMSLAKRLKQRYPDLNSAIPDEDEEEVDYNELAWSETVDGDTLDAVWGLGLNTGELFDEARPFVMQEANALGLCVMDEQAGEVYLPSGKVLVMSGRVAPAVVSTTPKPSDNNPPKKQYTLTVDGKTHTFEVTTWIDSRTKAICEGSPRNKEVLPIAFEHLTPLMTANGYKAYKGKQLFKRNFAEGWCEVQLHKGADMWPRHAELEIFIGLHCHPLTELVSKICYPNRSPETVAESTTVIVIPEQWLENFDGIEVNNTFTNAGEYHVRRYDQIEAVLANLTMKLQTLVLHALADCQTVADIDRHLNLPDDTARPFFAAWGEYWGYTRIIAAYLMGNPMLDALCEKYTKRPNGLPIQNPAVDYVRNHPLGVANDLHNDE